MGVPFDSGIERAVLGVEAHLIAKKHKFRQTISTHKIICTVFWERQGVLLVNSCLKAQP
jgi:hypothetical protein